MMLLLYLILYGKQRYYLKLAEMYNTIYKEERWKKNELVNPENPKAASKLYSWWVEHQEADRVRKEKEQKEEKRKQLIASAVAKLTPEELAALRNSF